MGDRVEDALKIYIDRLRGGASEVLKLELAPSVIGIDDADLKLTQPVTVEGKVYMADREVIVQLSVGSTVELPCKMCNEPADVEIKAAKLYHVQSVSEITSGVLDLAPLIREQLLLDAPHFVECGGGSCPTRVEIAQYLVSSDELND